MLHRGRTRVATVADVPVAATFVFGPYDGTFMPVLMIIEPAQLVMEAAARASVAAALEAVRPAPVEFDGYADDPTYLAILHDIPERRAGALTPMELVQISRTHKD